MRKFWKVFALYATLLLGGSVSFAQSSVVTASAITDSDSVEWVNGTVSISFAPNPATPNPGSYKLCSGGNLTPSVLNQGPVSLGSGAAFSFTVYDNSTICPVGSKYQITVCPNAQSKCGSITVPITGTSTDVTALINAAIPAPRFNAIAGAYGYADVETIVTIPTGATYWNVVNNCQRYNNSSSWACGGGSGIVTSCSNQNAIAYYTATPTTINCRNTFTDSGSLLFYGGSTGLQINASGLSNTQPSNTFLSMFGPAVTTAPSGQVLYQFGYVGTGGAYNPQLTFNVPAYTIGNFVSRILDSNGETHEQCLDTGDCSAPTYSASGLTAFQQPNPTVAPTVTAVGSGATTYAYEVSLCQGGPITTYAQCVANGQSLPSPSSSTVTNAATLYSTLGIPTVYNAVFTPACGNYQSSYTVWRSTNGGAWAMVAPSYQCGGEFADTDNSPTAATQPTSNTTGAVVSTSAYPLQIGTIFYLDSFVQKYPSGGTYSGAWSAGTYAQGASVTYSGVQYVSGVNSNSATPGTGNSWVPVLTATTAAPTAYDIALAAIQSQISSTNQAYTLILGSGVYSRCLDIPVPYNSSTGATAALIGQGNGSNGAAPNAPASIIQQSTASGCASTTEPTIYVPAVSTATLTPDVENILIDGNFKSPALMGVFNTVNSRLHRVYGRNETGGSWTGAPTDHGAAITGAFLLGANVSTCGSGSTSCANVTPQADDLLVQNQVGTNYVRLATGLLSIASGLNSITGVTGASLAGTGTVTLSSFNGSCSGATATVTVASGVFVSAVVSAQGTSCASAPTSATCTSGSGATCSGTATVTSTIANYASGFSIPNTCSGGIKPGTGSSACSGSNYWNVPQAIVNTPLCTTAPTVNLTTSGSQGTYTVTGGSVAAWPNAGNCPNVAVGSNNLSVLIADMPPGRYGILIGAGNGCVSNIVSDHGTVAAIANDNSRNCNINWHPEFGGGIIDYSNNSVFVHPDLDTNFGFEMQFLGSPSTSAVIAPYREQASGLTNKYDYGHVGFYSSSTSSNIAIDDPICHSTSSGFFTYNTYDLASTQGNVDNLTNTQVFKISRNTDQCVTTSGNSYDRITNALVATQGITTTTLVLNTATQPAANVTPTVSSAATDAYLSFDNARAFFGYCGTTTCPGTGITLPSGELIQAASTRSITLLPNDSTWGDNSAGYRCIVDSSGIGCGTNPASQSNTFRVSAAGAPYFGATPFTVSGCGTATVAPGSTGTVGTFTVGTGASTCTFTFTINGATGLAAAHGWIANVDDLTAGIHCPNKVVGSTTTVQAECYSTVTTGDTITFSATPY